MFKKNNKIMVFCWLIALTSCRTDELEGILDSSYSEGLSDPEIVWSTERCEATIGQENQFPTLTNKHGVTVNYSSSDSKIAVISKDGEITLCGGGTTTITATSEKSTKYDQASDSYFLIVNKADVVLRWSETKHKVSLTEENTFPVLEAEETNTISFSSSNESVATIDSAGKITILSAGTTIITATSAETSTHNSASASYNLVVTKSNAGIIWSENTCEAIIGEINSFPALNNPNNLDITYGSSNEGVATISHNGTITLTGEGSTIISASSAATDTFEADEDSFTLTVIQNESISKAEAGLNWSEPSYILTYGEDPEFPTLSNPNGLPVAYSSTNETIAAISSDGTITINSSGTTTIIAASEADDKYNACSVFYKLTVNKAEPNLSWSANNSIATFGKSNSFPTLNNPDGVAITYKTSDESVATITPDGEINLIGSGTATITAASESTALYTAVTTAYTLTVNKGSVSIFWSEDAYTALLGGTNSFPSLSIFPEDLEISYSSSDENIATISADGTLSLLATGRTTITAAFSGNRAYMAASDSYDLTVTDGSDEGAGTYNYPSTGDPDSNDDIVNTTFTRKIIITYSTSENAKVTGDHYGYVGINGNDVTVNNTGSEYIVYELRGTTTDGFLKIYSSARQALLLNNVSITNKAGAAINNQSKKRTFVMVEGTNALTDGSSYSDTPASEDEKAAFFSEGQLVFSGDGTLTVNASGKSGITSDDYIRVMNSPNINSTSSAGHAVRGQMAIQIDAGTINAKTSADMKKGFSSDSLVVFNGGTTTIAVTGGTAYDSEDADYTSSAGVKADKLFYMNDGSLTITNTGAGGKGINVGSNDTSNDCKAYFNGGKIDITCSGAYYTTGESGAKGIKVGKKFSSTSLTGDMYVNGGVVTVRAIGSNSSRDSGNEAVESKGVLEVSGGELFAYSTSDDAINSADDFTITGGYVCGISTGNDGLDANGNFYIKGGVVMAASAGSPEVGIDANSEGAKKLYVTGGVLFVTGGLESGASLTQKCYKASSFTKGIWYGLTVGSETYAFKTHSSAAGSSLIVSGSETPTLKSGITVSGGTTYFDGYANRNGSYSSGSSVTLSTYSGSSGGPGGRPW